LLKTAAQQPPNVNPAVFDLAKGVTMLNRDLIARTRSSIAALTAGALLIGFGTMAGLAASQYLVSQKGREFSPNDVAIKRGEAVTIVNDDADLRHHAYVDSDKFSFDSGDQEPGSKTNITFPVAGTFEVLCAIHPKMKLVVHVQ
jgi:plastocyanin